MKGKNGRRDLLTLNSTGILQWHELRKLSKYKARCTFRSQEISKGTRAAGKSVNSYSTWYQNKGNTNLCVAMMQRKWFSFQFV